MSVESWSIVGRVSVDIRPPVGRESEKLSAEYRSIFRRRTSTEYPSYVVGISVNCRSTVGGISVNCRSHISRVLI